MYIVVFCGKSSGIESTSNVEVRRLAVFATKSKPSILLSCMEKVYLTPRLGLGKYLLKCQNQYCSGAGFPDAECPSTAHIFAHSFATIASGRILLLLQMYNPFQRNFSSRDGFTVSTFVV